jgi:signal transduction histidine kinase
MQQGGGMLLLESAEQGVFGVDRRRVEHVVETLATLRSEGENLAELAHDARNMVTALGLYCDLLEEPGVLAAPFRHYAQELRLVAAASRRLVEKLVALDAPADLQTHLGRSPSFGFGRWPVLTAANRNAGSPAASAREGASVMPVQQSRRLDLLPAIPIANLAAELLANRNMLGALAGPSIALTMDVEGGAQPVRLTGEDLTRLLVNLVKNSSEAMPRGGRIHLALRERAAEAGAAACLVLTVDDNGPGISGEALEKIFIPGYTSHGDAEPGQIWPSKHRGLGLAITRSIIEAAGGRISASNREQGGARIEIELPLCKAGA